MANRYWVGGTGTWSSTNTTNWSVGSGGAGGASVPGSADTPIFDLNSGTGTVTFTNSGVTTGSITITTENITLSLGAALTTNSIFRIDAGTLVTNNYNITAVTFSLLGTGSKSLTLGSSLITLSSTTTPFNYAGSNLNYLDAGTSEIRLTGASLTFNGGSGLQFWNVNFSSTTPGTRNLQGLNLTFNTLTIAGPQSGIISNFGITGNQTITNLVVTASINRAIRTFIYSSSEGVTRTLNCFSVDLTNVDFKDIAITGAAVPATGTSLGDCKGNSGITFDTPKTVYYGSSASNSWGSTLANYWSFSIGGSTSSAAFPLPQDTAVIPANYPAAGNTLTINGAFNIGTVDLSSRTTNALTVSNASIIGVYGNWISGTNVTYSGTGTLVFSARNLQTITSAGGLFTNSFTISSIDGTVRLEDAFRSNRSNAAAINLTYGTFDANGYNVTLSGASGGFQSTNSNIRTVNIGSGVWTLPGTSPWNCLSSTNLTVTGTGTLKFTSASLKTMNGGDKSYPTIEQAGSGTLYIAGSNTINTLINSTYARIQFQVGNTNTIENFNVNGIAGTLLPIGSSGTTQTTLRKPSAWNVGANSVDAGNNTGLSFTAGLNNYLTISYINGINTAAPTDVTNGNFLMFFS